VEEVCTDCRDAKASPELSNTSARRPEQADQRRRAALRDGAMPITELYFPVLSRFLCAVEMTTGLPAQPLDAPPEQRQRVEEDEKKVLPKGVVLGPDGKPYVQFYGCIH
jgi:hypothetical protein